jgi:transcriptional regulator with XRE-family HTH domain
MSPIPTKTTARRGHVRGRLADGSANPVDTHVGRRMRLRRTLLGLSQDELGQRLGLTFQQVQKYERGANRIGASRLFDLASILEVPVSFFFDDMTDDVRSHSPVAVIKGTADTAAPAPGYVRDPLHRREILELVRDFDALPTDESRTSVRRIIKAIIAASEPGSPALAAE